MITELEAGKYYKFDWVDSDGGGKQVNMLSRCHWCKYTDTNLLQTQQHDGDWIDLDLSQITNVVEMVEKGIE